MADQRSPATLSALERWARQDAEWHLIAEEMIATGAQPSAYQVSLEMRKRMLARGERPVTYEEIVSEHEAQACATCGKPGHRPQDHAGWDPTEDGHG